MHTAAEYQAHAIASFVVNLFPSAMNEAKRSTDQTAVGMMSMHATGMVWKPTKLRGSAALRQICAFTENKTMLCIAVRWIVVNATRVTYAFINTCDNRGHGSLSSTTLNIG